MEIVKGEIYCITNTQNGKLYVGQTVTHRRNRGKYRPFGSAGRLKDHVSEAICNTKKKQCWYLNSAIRKYGAEAFEVKLIETCELSELDDRERYYILECGSIYPNGYNLTAGGKTTNVISIQRDVEPSTPGKRGGCKYRSGDTRLRISQQLQEATASEKTRQSMSQRTQNQHHETKLQLFEHIIVDPEKIDAYIYPQKNRVVVKLEGKRITFASKHSTPDERYTQARNFLLEISKTARLPN